MDKITILEKAAVSIGRNLRLPGVGRMLNKLFPVGMGSARYIEGIRPRSDGLLLSIDTREYIDWMTYFHGEYESHLRKVFVDCIEPGDIVLDIGANVGMHTLTLSTLVGDAGKVIALEPNPVVFDKLKNNLELNAISNVVSLQLATGRETKQMKLRVPRRDSREASNSGLASFHALDTPHDEFDVKIEPLDEILSGEDVMNVSLVKIDVQGFEEEVFSGMRRMMDGSRPTLVFEYEKWAWEVSGSCIERVMKMLGQRGYECFSIESDGNTQRLPLNAESWSDLPHLEILAVAAAHQKRQQVENY